MVRGTPAISISCAEDIASINPGKIIGVSTGIKSIRIAVIKDDDRNPSFSNFLVERFLSSLATLGKIYTVRNDRNNRRQS